VASLDVSARRLADLSRQLNDYTDRLNARLLHIEEDLRNAGLGLDLWLDPITGRTPDGTEERFRIGWTKSREWGFFWESYRDDGQPDWQPLLNAPRWVRVAAFPHVAALIERLAVMAKEALDELEPIAKDLPPAPDDGPSDEDLAKVGTASDEEDIPF